MWLTGFFGALIAGDTQVVEGIADYGVYEGEGKSRGSDNLVGPEKRDKAGSGNITTI